MKTDREIFVEKRGEKNQPADALPILAIANFPNFNFQNIQTDVTVAVFVWNLELPTFVINMLNVQPISYTGKYENSVYEINLKIARDRLLYQLNFYLYIN